MIHVAIDARLPDKGQGGVQQVIRSLAEGFRLIENSDVKRSWIVYKGTEWWEGVFPQEDNLIVINPPFGKISIFVANKAPRLLSLIYPILSKFKSQKPPFDDQLSALCVDVVHMPFQDGFVTKLPYIYHPHDLQHEYFPEYFSKSQIKHRNRVWKQLANGAQVVMAASPLVKNDFKVKWNISCTKIAILPIPPPTRSVNEIATLPITDYLVYPAVFWKHKNHYRLVQAIHIAKIAMPQIQVIFAGASGPELKSVKRLSKSLSLNSNIHFWGHVPEREYGALLKHSRAVIIPSLFEAFSLTVQDAQQLGVPVLCSNLPTFHYQCSEFATYFDPLDPEDIANTILTFFETLNSSNSENAFRQGELNIGTSTSDLALQIQDLYYSCLTVGCD
jgi:glycosyltransferase involved in cell wall biosynthesis